MDQGGTPKLGYTCSVCLDWGTLTRVVPVGDGVTAVQNIPCPSCPKPEPAAPAVCRCDGGPIEVPLADAVLITTLRCLLHDDGTTR